MNIIIIKDIAMKVTASPISGKAVASRRRSLLAAAPGGRDFLNSGYGSGTLPPGRIPSAKRLGRQRRNPLLGDVGGVDDPDRFQAGEAAVAARRLFAE